MSASLPSYARRPVDPQLREVWEKAAQKAVTLEVATRALAQRLRFRLYDTRKIMQAKADPLYESTQFLTISLTPQPEKNNFHVSVGPTDAKLKDILQAAGFSGNGTAILSPEDLDLDPTK